METVQNLDFMEFQKAITSQILLTFCVIYIALLSGVTLFLGILLVMAYSKSPDETAKSQDILSLLTIVHIVIASSCYLVSFIVFRFLTNPARLRKIKSSVVLSPGRQSSALEQQYLAAIFSAHIVRAGFFEGPALLGLIICLIGVLDGCIQQHPIYWLNLFSFVVMAGMMIHTFPTKVKLEDLFKKRCTIKPSHVC
jgi:hypothetical protein